MNHLLFPKLEADYFLLQTVSRDHPAPKSQLINSAIDFWREVRLLLERADVRGSKSRREGVDAFWGVCVHCASCFCSKRCGGISLLLLHFPQSSHLHLQPFIIIERSGWPTGPSHTFSGFSHRRSALCERKLPKQIWLTMYFFNKALGGKTAFQAAHVSCGTNSSTWRDLFLWELLRLNFEPVEKSPPKQDFWFTQGWNKWLEYWAIS